MLLYCSQYSVVTFINDEEPSSDVVPTSWLLSNATQCYWPTFPKRGTSDKRSTLICSLAKPDKSWPIVNVQFRYSYGKFLNLFDFKVYLESLPDNLQGFKFTGYILLMLLQIP